MPARLIRRPLFAASLLCAAVSCQSPPEEIDDIDGSVDHSVDYSVGPDAEPPSDARPDRDPDPSPGPPDAEPRPDRGPRPLPPCEPVPVFTHEGEPTGLVSCGPHHFDRQDDVICPDNVADVHYTPCNQVSKWCIDDAHCGAGQRCVNIGSYCGCETFCRTDADCAEDQACVCRGDGTAGTYSRCERTRCRSSADCDGRPCGLTLGSCDEPRGFDCRGPQDTCLTNEDCPGEDCVYRAPEGHFTCYRDDFFCQ